LLFRLCGPYAVANLINPEDRVAFVIEDCSVSNLDAVARQPV